MPWLVTASVQLGKIVHAVSAHSGTVPLDGQKLTPICAAQSAEQTAALISVRHRQWR